MNDKSMKSQIDWNLPQVAFRHFVRGMVNECQKKGKVLVLPMQVSGGMNFLDKLSLTIGQVNCEGCHAPCCKVDPSGLQISVLPPEAKRLAEKYGWEHFIIKDDKYWLPTPCPFLKNNRCTIYQDRPLVCVLYPFQPGGTDGEGNPLIALASSCPESRRITKQVFMMSWRIRQKFIQLDDPEIMKVITP